MAGQLAPRPLLVVHGKADTRLPYACGVHSYDWAQEPKQLVLYEGAEHRFDECAAALEQLLTQWIPTTPGTIGIRLMLQRNASTGPADPGLNRVLAAAAQHAIPVNVRAPGAWNRSLDWWHGIPRPRW